MMQSMTGFGRSEQKSLLWHCTVELRSVNARYLDVSVRLPTEWRAIENTAIKWVGACCNRGKIDASVRLIKQVDANTDLFDETTLTKCRAFIQDVGTKLQQPIQVSLGDLIKFADWHKGNQGGSQSSVTEWKKAEADEIYALIEVTFKDALQQLGKARLAEGQALYPGFASGVHQLENLINESERLIEEAAAARGANFLTQLAYWQKQLPENTRLPEEARVAQEVLLWLEKNDVSEEIERLRGHLTAIKKLLDSKEPMGRTFDFMLQELNRECNTLATKSASYQANHHALEAKVVLEKLREQIQNIE